MHDEKQQKLAELIDSFDTAMLVTRSLEGSLRARPMVIAGHEQEGLLTFASLSDAEKLQEVVKHPEVSITLQRRDLYLSLSGQARLETDVQEVERLRSSLPGVWLPKDEQSGSLTLIHVDLVRAEYWDRTGLRRLEWLWEAGKALAGDSTADPRVEEHAKVTPP